MEYSQDVFAAEGNPSSSHSRDKVPKISDKAERYLAESEDLREELFDIASLFRVPVTNNIPWFEDNDPNKPIFHVGDFMDMIEKAFRRHGWIEMPEDKLKIAEDNE